MSVPAAAGTLVAQAGGAPSPQPYPLGIAQSNGLPQMTATAQERRKSEGGDETLAPAQLISLAGPEVSEDEGDGGSGSSGKKKKKQRSMAELIKGLDLNMGDDGGLGEEGIDEPAAPQEEEKASSDTAAAAPPPPASALKAADKQARKRKMAGEGDADGDGDSDGEAKGSSVSPTDDVPETQQAVVFPDGGVSSGRRERKKSKYLSPPYTMVIEKKPSFSRSAFGDALDPEGASGISSPLGRCSSFSGRKKREDQEQEPHFSFGEGTPPVSELLAELRCAAISVMYLVDSRHDSTVRGCFALFRIDSYLGNIESNTLGNKAPPATPNVACVEETKTPAPAPVTADIKASQQDGDTKAITETPVAAAQKNAHDDEANKSASGKRIYNKRKPKPVVEATTPEVNGGVEERRPRGRPKKTKSKENEENNAIDVIHTMVVDLSVAVPKSPARIGTAPPHPTPTPTPSLAPAPVNTLADTSAPTVTQPQANGGASFVPVVDLYPPEKNEAKKKKRKKRSGPPGSASLIVTFAPGADLPTKDHLVGFFSKYGALDEARTEVRANTRVACIAYATKTDAQRAIGSPDRDQAFAPGVATFRIKYARQARQLGGGSVASPTAGSLMPTRTIPRPPLEFVKKNLESMIAALESSRPAGAGSRVPAGGSEAEADPRDELVDQMSNLLTKVNKLLVEGSSSDTLANGVHATPVVTSSAAAGAASFAAAAAGSGAGLTA